MSSFLQFFDDHSFPFLAIILASSFSPVRPSSSSPRNWDEEAKERKRTLARRSSREGNEREGNSRKP